MAGTLGWRRCILQSAATGQSPRHRPTAPPPPERSAPTRPFTRSFGIRVDGSPGYAFPGSPDTKSLRAVGWQSRPSPATHRSGSRCMHDKRSPAEQRISSLTRRRQDRQRLGRVKIALAGTGLDLVVEGLADHVAVAVDAVGSSIPPEHLQVGPGCRWSCWRYRCSADGG